MKDPAWICVLFAMMMALQMMSDPRITSEFIRKTMVWVVDPATRTVSIRDVTLAARDGSAVRVLDGLTSGTRVVTAGVHSLTPGQTVKIADGSF